MSRTLLMHRIRRLARGHASSTAPRVPEDLPTTDRRRFARQLLLGLTALASDLGPTACVPRARHTRASAKPDGAPRVAVVGAGLAGLTCAYHLAEAGLRADVFEASARVGGRVASVPKGHFLDGQVGELGGEFIDTGHVTLHTLARSLGIQLEDRLDFTSAHEARNVWWLAGRSVQEALLAEQFAAVASVLSRAADDALRDKQAFAALDRTSMADWLAAHLSGQRELRTALNVAYRGEYGLETHEQSALNLLLVLGKTENEFRLFGDSDQRFHAHGGNQIFAQRLAARVEPQLVFDRQLARVTGDARRGYKLWFRDRAGNGRESTADILVLALPFCVLRHVDLSELALSPHKLRMIKELGYGTPAKVLGGFRRRTWLELHRSSGSVLTDQACQELWDSSIGQSGRAGLLTNFVGGAAGMQRQLDTERCWQEVLLPLAEQVFPGISQDYVPGSGLLKHWPSEPFARGGYACYRPGQWAFLGMEGLPEADGTIHFCGEHTSVDFQGFMEGAAETGAMVAGAVLEQLGLAPSAEHRSLLAFKRVVAQPAYGEHVAASTCAMRASLLDQALLSFCGPNFSSATPDARGAALTHATPAIHTAPASRT